MTPIFEQSSTERTIAEDMQRMLEHWRKNWALARRSEGPVTAIICAALSTAESLRRYS